MIINLFCEESPVRRLRVSSFGERRRLAPSTRTVVRCLGLAMPRLCSVAPIPARELCGLLILKAMHAQRPGTLAERLPSQA